MNKKLLILGLLLAVVVISGCVAPAAPAPAITNPEEATKAVANISDQVDKVSSVLDGIDRALG